MAEHRVVLLGSPDLGPGETVTLKFAVGKWLIIGRAPEHDVKVYGVLPGYAYNAQRDEQGPRAPPQDNVLMSWKAPPDSVNTPKPGYIFVPCLTIELPPDYVASWLGATGFWAELEPGTINGWSPITVAVYEAVVVDRDPGCAQCGARIMAACVCRSTLLFKREGL